MRIEYIIVSFVIFLVILFAIMVFLTGIPDIDSILNLGGGE